MSHNRQPAAAVRSRRDILRFGVAGIGLTGIGLAATAFSLPAAAGSVGQHSTYTGPLAAALSSVLRTLGTAPCVRAAARLDDIATTGRPFAFALRNANIDAAGASLIADALGSVSDRERAALTSFSLSYNPAIGDAGAVALAAALPPTLSELGLVGCGFGDTGGQALFRWASAAPGLRVICIENNDLSAGIKKHISALSDGPANVFVMV